MPFTPFTWVDEILAGVERYKIVKEDGAPLIENVEIVLTTPVAQAGTPVKAERMNYVENGMAAVEQTTLLALQDRVSWTELNTKLTSMPKVVSTAQTVLSDCYVYVSDYLEIAANITLELLSNSMLEVG